MTIRKTEECPFERIDQVICFYDDAVVRSRIKNQISKIKLNGKVCTKFSAFVGDGDVIEYFLNENSKHTALPVPELKIVYKDDDFFIIDKPAGLTVHHGVNNESGTVEDALFQLLDESGREELESYRYGIVHRLDKETSGLLLVARNAETAAYFTEEFKNRRVFKEYRTFVKGYVSKSEGALDTGMCRSARSRIKFETCGKDEGREAITKWKVLNYFSSFASELSVVIETGRTHQIRVHMSSMGNPVLGDELYARKDKIIPDYGLMLHAYKLGFALPSGKYTEFVSPLPERFEKMRAFLEDIV